MTPDIEAWLSDISAKQRGKWRLVCPPSATMEEWEAVKGFQRTHFPIRFFFQDTLRYPMIRAWRRWVKDPLYYLKCALFRRYNRIHLKYLPPTWTDIQTRMPHAIFQFIEDFVEKESGGRDALQAFSAGLVIDADEAEDSWEKGALINQAKWQKEVLVIYDYWQGRKKLLAPAELLEYRPRKDFATEEEWAAEVKRDMDTEEQLEKVDEDFMIRVIQLRRHLWT